MATRKKFDTALKTAEPTIQKYIGQLKAEKSNFQNEIAKLQKENAKLKIEILNLKIENQECKKQIYRLRKRLIKAENERGGDILLCVKTPQNGKRHKMTEADGG